MKKTYKIYQVDAFADKVFSGNPAAICPLNEWLNDDLLQKIAMENNLSETAFYVEKDSDYEIRWFTPTIEVDLCGHATLAAAYVLFNHENHTSNNIKFQSPRSGLLTVTKHDELLSLNFPSDTIVPIALDAKTVSAFNIKPRLAFKGKSDIMLIFDNENEIQTLVPELEKVSKLDARGVIATAKGNAADFVSRFFGPQSGIDEDPVTGSAHTTLVPYWSEILGKNEMTAMQLSERKGYLTCKYLKERVEISGKCALYMTGEIHLDSFSNESI